VRVLVTSQPGSGHWRPLVPLAKALQAAGHEVAFATTPVACATLADLGFHCFPVGIDDWLVQPGAPPAARHDPTTPAATMWVDVFVDIRAKHALPDLLATCDAWRPDLIVRELTEFAGCVAAERVGIPHAAVQVGAWRPALHALVGPALDHLRLQVGLPADLDLTMLFRYLLLTPVPPSFIDPAQSLPATAYPMRYVPYDVGPGGERWVPGWIGTLDARPTVYATLGTVNNRTPGLTSTILAALRDEPTNLMLTIGSDIDPADFGEQPSHVHVERYVPQSLLLPTCDLVVCHGGFGTVLTTLRAGLPMVIIPVAADQPDNARRCAELGVAEVISSDTRTPEAIRDAVRWVLGTLSYRRNAERLRDEMRQQPGLEQTVDLLEQLASTKLPLRARHESPTEIRKICT
jgi:UDP:flavonoid glycosyltransferase YjiC (YdhE family)